MVGVGKKAVKKSLTRLKDTVFYPQKHKFVGKGM